MVVRLPDMADVAAPLTANAYGRNKRMCAVLMSGRAMVSVGGGGNQTESIDRFFFGGMAIRYKLIERRQLEETC